MTQITASVAATATASIAPSMARKPVLFRENARTALTLRSDEFREKLLCDGITLNLGDACVYSCEFCYVEAMMRKLDKKLVEAHNAAQGLVEGGKLGFRDVVIRRRNAVELVRSQLVGRGGRPRFRDANDTRVVFSSTLVDVAANMDLLRETAEACTEILTKTHWQIRLLSKSNLLHLLVKDGMIPAEHHQRMIFGFSTGTLDDGVSRAIETGSALVSKRLESLHWLQDHGFRTFGMICPSLPQTDYDKFSREICDAIRVDKCEHVWAEVINVRGKSLPRSLCALERGGYGTAARLLNEVSTDRDKWEAYARATFEAHARHIPAQKLRFLQYITTPSAIWWVAQQKKGAVLLGKHAQSLGAQPNPQS